MRKVYIGLKVFCDVNGKITPQQITWDDGRVFEVDRLLSVERVASINAGGVGDRYTCMVAGKQVHMWLESGRWFMEGKDKAPRAPRAATPKHCPM